MPRAYSDRKPCTMRTNSSVFSISGMWPQPSITSRREPGIDRLYNSPALRGIIGSSRPQTMRVGSRLSRLSRLGRAR